jgi:hypothetical protein
MNRGKYVFAQFLETVFPYELDVCVVRYGGNRRVRKFNCRSQFIAMVFGQLTGRDSLRDTVTCLAAQDARPFHVGIRGQVNRSTLADANETRDWRIWQDLAGALIKRAQQLYYDERGNASKSRVYAIDATTIDLCMSLYQWAVFRRTKSAVRLHTVLDLNSNIPVFATITDGKKHELKELPKVFFEPGACYVLDRGYVDFKELFRIDRSGATFVIRAKSNLGACVVESRTPDPSTGVVADDTVEIGTRHSKTLYPKHARLVSYFDKDLERSFRFLTNDFDLPATEIAGLYKRRWAIELFFKWIKQHLKIKRFWGLTENAVRTQIWIAISTYVMAQILKKNIGTELSLYQILQILSVSAFSKVELNQLLTKKSNMPENDEFCKQLILFDF